MLLTKEKSFLDKKYFNKIEFAHSLVHFRIKQASFSRSSVITNTPIQLGIKKYVLIMKYTRAMMNPGHFNALYPIFGI